MTSVRDLLDEDGENRAVRCFLGMYQCGGSPSVKSMKSHLEHSGFSDCWPDWVNDPKNAGHLTKGGAQLWIRHLLGMEQSSVDHRGSFEQAAYAHYLERHAAGKTADSSGPVGTREQLLWRDEQGNYGVLMFNAAWWAWQSALVTAQAQKGVSL